MDKVSKKISGVFIRYLIMVLVAIPNLWIFYFIFTPLTVYPIYFLLSLFFGVSLSGTTIFVSNSFPIEIVKACVAGSAYYLLLILNLSIPNIKLAKRLKMILVSFIILLILNLLRIFLLSIMYVSRSSLFDVTHQVFWYLLNVLFIVGIWFLIVKKFKIKETPFYSDIKFFLHIKKKAKKSKHPKKNK